MSDLLRQGNSKQAVAAARTPSEFIKSQLAKLAVHAPPRSRRDANQDSRLWLDDGHWLAWTIEGEFVSVEEIEPGSMRSSPEVRLLRPDELPDVFAVNRLIPNVIALYRGDSLAQGPVWRYIMHHDLRRALEAALALARTEEELLRAAAAPSIKAPPARPSVQRTTKTRHHPEGNFIVYRRPNAGEDLLPFSAILQLPPVPEAFPDRRAASRFFQRMSRRGFDVDELVVARVLGSVEVQPGWRPGIQVPRDSAEAIELIRREPRVVLPELKAVWLPRYVQAEDGSWQLKPAQKRGTVRSRWNQILLRRVTAEGRRVAAALEDHAIRRSAGSESLAIGGQLATAMQVVQKAERRLPEQWLNQLGMVRESLGPDWTQLAEARPITDCAHWLRAPCEHGRPHVDGQRRRIVELRIDDLAGLLEMARMRPRLLLVKPSVSEPPVWRLPCKFQDASATA